ncbi:MAG: putative rRNA methylase YqxC [Methanophagales archaeon]|nr:S4 domain-containing protein [Methanophagales archaeon]MCU4139574.1 putative rRNA methylase YqxC [Methanophagales archaeon]
MVERRAREKKAEGKERLDVLLVRKGLFSSRQRAKEAIKRGFIVVNGKKCEKPAESVHLDAKIEVLLPDSPLIVEGSEGSEGVRGIYVGCSEGFLEVEGNR